MNELPETLTPASSANAADGELTVVRRGRWLLVRFAEVHDVLSWAVVGGGARQAIAVVWYHVDRRDLVPPVDARRFLQRQLAGISLSDAVALMTGRRLDAYVDVEHHSAEVSARCVATVGLSNALRVGDRPAQPPGEATRLTAEIGTINLLCRMSLPLTGEALIESLALAAEARTLAMLEASVASRGSGQPATGTGTDCIVIATPQTGKRLPYVGKHTAAGCVIGAAVYDAVRRGIEAWQQEHPEA